MTSASSGGSGGPNRPRTPHGLMTLTTDNDLYIRGAPPSWPHGRTTPAFPPAQHASG